MNIGDGDYAFFKPVNIIINECFEKGNVPIHLLYRAIEMSANPVASVKSYILTCNLPIYHELCTQSRMLQGVNF